MKSKLLTLCVALLAAGIFVGCSSSTSVSVAVVHPPQFGTHQFKRIYIEDFKNLTKSPKLGDRLNLTLQNAIQSSGQFQLIDKQVYGKFAGAKAGNVDDIMAIGGTITVFRPEQNLTKANVKVTDADKKTTTTHTDFTRTARLMYTVQFKLTKASDATIFGSPEVTKEFKDSWTVRDAEPGMFDMDDVARQTEANVVSDFMSRIIPVREIVKVDFYHEDSMPELEAGISAASRGDWAGSVSVFQAATTKYASSKTDLLAKAYYDLGLALEFNHNYNEAKDAFSKAETMDNGTSQYRTAFSDCMTRQLEYTRLKEQSWEQ